eukprot:364567-Chlamydomonas_euryale.AAC.10
MRRAPGLTTRWRHDAPGLRLRARHGCSEASAEELLSSFQAAPGLSSFCRAEELLGSCRVASKGCQKPLRCRLSAAEPQQSLLCPTGKLARLVSCANCCQAAEELLRSYHDAPWL